ncbi:MAG: hypothetical protein CME19_23435 [Gemmatimonadetes bacterium]|nr:hypothetical protein [Gemmatimonadota bacterium]
MVVTLLAATMALPLPDDFNPKMNTRQQVRGEQTLQQSREAASLTKNLVANGTQEDIALAVKVLDALFSCQDTDPESRIYGNYLWYYEDEGVRDPNGAAFCLASHLPMMLDHEERLPKEARGKMRESIRLALAAVANIDVTQMYTNIAVKDFSNTILGGQLLKDPALLERGNRKLVEWMQLTDANGIPVEYNSPTYYRVSLRALFQLVHYATDPAVKTRAHTAIAQMDLTKALHVHPATGLMSGPHGRAQRPVFTPSGPTNRRHIANWIEEGKLPG